MLVVQIRASDNAGNTVASIASGTLTQLNDNKSPDIRNAHISPTGTYGAPGSDLPAMIVTATITDPGSTATGINASRVLASIYVHGSTALGVYLSNGGSGDVYTGTCPLGRYFGNDTEGTSRVYTVQVNAYDNVGNKATANASGSITQLSDTAAPKLSNAAVTPQFIDNAGTKVTLSVNAADASGVTRILAGVFTASGGQSGYLGYSDLVDTGNGTWTITRDLPAGESTPTVYKFSFSANDAVDNTSMVTRYAVQAGTTSLPVPTLSKISPVSAFTRTDVTLTLTGTNFSTSSIVLFDGLVVPATLVSPTSLTCSVVKSFLPSAKQVSVQVYNSKPAGGTSASKIFTINAESAPPALSSINPATCTAGGGAFVLTANGTNFTSASLIKWNGVTQPTTFVSDTQLTALIPASLTASAGTASVTVTTPHVATSAAKSFAVTQPQ